MASCANAYKPFDEGNGDVPTATGNPATDLTDATYTGDLNLVSYDPPDMKDTFDNPLTGFTLQIAGNKIVNAGAYEGLLNVQILKTASGEYNANGKSNSEGINAEEYIKFTVSGDDVEILEWTAYISSEEGGISYTHTYKGTLTKDASAGS